MSTAPVSISNAPSLIQHRRKSQVFVEIPPSPLFKGRAAPPSKVDPIPTFQKPESHKENAVPLSTKTSISNLPISVKIKGKRKLEDEDPSIKPSSKKAKLPQVDDDALVACHQCRQKKAANILLQCTRNSKSTNKRCRAFYCDTCLRVRYGEQLEDISKRKPPQSQEGHDLDAEYQFTCPRCAGFCNCAPCRKKQGLAPVGKFTSANGQSVREILEKNPEASGSLPKNTAMSMPKPLKTAKSESSSKEIRKTQARRKATSTDTKKKPAPEPIWMPIPDTGTKEEIEDRIHLREFILRFNPILNIGLRNLEELDDFTSLHDQSTKAVLIALLDLVACEDSVQKKTIQAKVKKIRSLGLNWTSIVLVLYDLRDSLPEHHTFRSLPDIIQPNVELSYNTRRAKIQGVHADQLLPLLLFLINVASEGESVRQELEEGNKQAKDSRIAYFKTLREETERWTVEKAELTEEKSQSEKKANWDVDAWKVKHRKAEAEHKAIVADIQHSHRPEVDGCAPRFMPLSTDPDGRTYYVLSACGPHRGKKDRLPSEGERLSMKRWGWFVAVWGKPGTVVQQNNDGDNTDEDEDEEEDPSAERWWGFFDVQEMRKLSKWLTYRAETTMLGKKCTIEKSAPINDSQPGTATSSTLASRLSSPSRTVTVSESADRHVSPLSDLSASDSRDNKNDKMDLDEPDVDGEHETNVSQPATQAGVKALAKDVLEFADFVEWRLKRAEKSGKE